MEDKTTQSGRLVVVALISIVVLGGVALGVYGRWSAEKEPVVPSDCEGWNTEGYFERTTVQEVTGCLRMGADVRDRSADGITPLFWAVRETKNPGVIIALLSAGADVNEQLETEGALATPLLVAANYQHLAAVTGVLLDAGADPNFRGPKGRTALHFAARRGQWEVVSLLLEYGAQPNTADDNGQTPLSTVTFARGWDHHGLIANEIWTIRALLRSGGDAAALANHGWTEIHTVALSGNNPDELSALVNQGIDPDAETSSGWRASHMAAFGNEDSRIISTLLDLGVNPNATIGDTRTIDLRRRLSEIRNRRSDDARIGDSRTALHCAAFGNRNPRVIAALIEGGADPNAGTTTGWTPLHAAAYANPNPDVAEALLRGGADANSQLKENWTKGDLFPYLAGVSDEDEKLDYLWTLKGTDGRILYLNGLSTPLHVAVDFPQDRSVVETLIRGGADPGMRDVEGETPLHHVESSEDAVTLIKAGADPNARDEDGRVPLHNAMIHAELSSEMGLVATLIDRGAIVNARSDSGWAPLHIAAQGGRESNAKLIDLLIRRGADPNARTAYGWTPLHLAADFKSGKPAVIDALIGAGADLNSRNLKGEAPLFNAVVPSRNIMGAVSNHDVVTRLVDAGADPNLRDENGRTPLHKAIVHFSDVVYDLDNVEELRSAMARGAFSDALTIEALLDGGADAALGDDDGLTPWDLAQETPALKGTRTYWRLNDARFE